MAQISIRLLGRFRAQRSSGQRLTIRRKKAQALLAYLALPADLAHSRESLAGLLWSGMTDDHARHNLRQTLFALRQAIAVEPTPFALEDELIGLRPAAVDVDVAAFRRCLQQGTRTALQEAAALYQGDLLEGFTLGEPPFDDWVADERHRLRELALEGLETLLAMEQQDGATEPAIRTALRLLALDPVRESAHRALMELYARQGRRASALRQYQRCVEVLRRELGVGPEAATTQCYQNLLRRWPPRPEARRDPVPGPATAMPETRYAKSGDVNIAYQVIGDGPADLVLVPGWVSNLECFWEEPRVGRFFRRLASFARLILFDKRGTGLSDRVPLSRLPTLEQRITDVRAVMDAVGSERAVLVGYSEGGSMCALFAATHPERTAGLVLIGSYARRIWTPDHPWGPSEKDYQDYIEMLWRDWGRPIWLEKRAPSVMHDEEFSRWWARFLRMSASPAAAVAFSEINRDLDVRLVLPAIRVPTLVLHAVGDQTVDVRCGRYLSAGIPHSRYVELPSGDHLPWLSDADAILDEIQRLVSAVPSIAEPDWLLVTIVAAILVRPESLGGDVAAPGDGRQHDLVRTEIVRFRGRLLDAAGPTVVAAFDGPARAIRCASAIVDGARRLGMTARAGLHTGECAIGPGGLSGAAVEVARQVAREAAAGEVVVSTTVKDLVAGSGITFVGWPGPAGRPLPGPLFSVVSPADPEGRPAASGGDRSRRLPTTQRR